MNNKVQIAVSLLSSDFANLERDINRCQAAGVDILHVDVMDGSFVPNITIGPPVVKAINKVTDMPIDCHLMIENPDKYVEDFVKAGADYLSIHVEASRHLHRSIQLIKSFGIKAGIALNPITPLEYVFSAAEYCDFILLMSVNPGFGGQSFIPSFNKRCRELRAFLDSEGLQNVEIEVDGGIKASNLKETIESGANLIVSGSGLFSGNLEENTQAMKNIIREIS